MPVGQKSLEFVTVGDVGNAPDVTGFGAVNYEYQMGKYEVTAAQYCQFLNSVAKTDTYGLYDSHMASSFAYVGIIQSGSPGNYSYNLTAGRENFPINYASWGDIARFANWLHNGQPIGPQNANSTEDGAYTLNGATSRTRLAAVVRNPAAKFFIPSENEWYKSAFYKSGGLDSGYWKYPTRSDSAPSNLFLSSGTNNANYQDENDVFTDPVNHLTPVGYFSQSPGPYMTFDQAGNVSEFNETLLIFSENTVYRGVRGGSYTAHAAFLDSSYSGLYPIEVPPVSHGFRIAAIPEPSSIAFLISSAGVLGWKLRRKQ
jgi:formylglycine-generating enzyme required for sulfatase activity